MWCEWSKSKIKINKTPLDCLRLERSTQNSDEQPANWTEFHSKSITAVQVHCESSAKLSVPSIMSNPHVFSSLCQYVAKLRVYSPIPTYQAIYRYGFICNKNSIIAKLSAISFFASNAIKMPLKMSKISLLYYYFDKVSFSESTYTYTDARHHWIRMAWTQFDCILSFFPAIFSKYNLKVKCGSSMLLMPRCYLNFLFTEF